MKKIVSLLLIMLGAFVVFGALSVAVQRNKSQLVKYEKDVSKAAKKIKKDLVKETKRLRKH